ncbi:PLP-dependent aminotransferase family protein [Jiangella muralis]|uniref:MocR-like pyridoxine biosynthesis transcription factor PdxR n=1 Tax=Jiangella muralis TaxID=702383 RepID=UPI00196A1AD0|nr:PLP-dependent aminotransferase family protein [Jiangella muralis]
MLDRSRPRSLRVQIEAELRRAIRAGRLQPGSALPSTRALAVDLGVTRGVVVDAYDQLTAEGYLLSRPGSGTVVSPATARPASSPPTVPADAGVDVDFYAGESDLDGFPRSAWARATRTALQTMPTSELAYGHVQGIPSLRHELADYLGRVRGVDAAPEHILVGHGFNHVFGLVSRVLRDSGRTIFAVEDPGYDRARAGLESLGIAYRGVDVDDNGLVVDQLRATGARVVVVTPAHQHPTGVVLTPERRHELVDWAQSVDGYVIEDDYDAEYRYDRRPVGAVQGLAPDRVIHAGTTSKALAPGVRLGWLVLPPALVDRVADHRRTTDGSTSGILQATFASFLGNGDLDRHLRRMRRVYRQRRDGLVAALARWLPELTPSGAAAGLHVLVRLPPQADESEVVDRTLAAGVRVYPLAQYRPPHGRPLPPALVLGYGSVTPQQSDHGVRVLATTLEEALRTRSGRR